VKPICFSIFKANMGIGQESALSPILSALYIASIFHIFEKRSKIHLSSISILIFLFMNDSLFISQEKIYEK